MTIKQRQHLLAYLGYYLGAVDGDWGSGSRAACAAFQKDRNITADGYGGPETDEQLRYAVANDLFRTTPVKNPTDLPELANWWDEIEFFTHEEFQCKCGGRYCKGYPAEMQEAVVRVADRARKHFGRPAHVISGLRCPQHNANEGGEANSQHMYGEAIDLYIEGVTGDELLAFVKAQPEVRYAYKINSTNVHFDIPKGKR